MEAVFENFDTYLKGFGYTVALFVLCVLFHRIARATT